MSVFSFRKIKKCLTNLCQISWLHNRYTFSKLNKLVRQKTQKTVIEKFYPNKNNFLYVPASCLPYHISGYTTRTHEILKSIYSVFNNDNLNIEDNLDSNINYSSKLNTNKNSDLNLNSNSADLINNFNLNLNVADLTNNLNLFVLTRCGYPWDRKDSLVLPKNDSSENILDNIQYDHIATPKNNKLTAKYAEEASIEIEKYIIKNNISCVHAASNHVNALPALIAAKRLGIPFQYEMRGLWELTRISRQPEFEKSHNFKLGLGLESFVAKHSDKVFVISNQLSLYIQKNWGISKDKIFLLPNCADVERIKPNFDLNKNNSTNDFSSDKYSEKLNTITVSDANTETNTDIKCSKQSLISQATIDSKEAINSKDIVIGYAGSLIVYEGLQTLLKAMDLLVHQKNLNIKLNVIGDGEYRQNLEELSKSLNLENNVTFYGRLSPDEAKQKQDDCSLICIPREPFDVCKIIPPIKLVEAMAKEKCVVVPDLPVFVDELNIKNNSDDSIYDLNEFSDTNSQNISSDDKITINHNYPNKRKGLNSNSNSISSDKQNLSSAQDICEKLSHNDSGCIFFKSGNYQDLANVLERYAFNNDDLIKRGKKARKYVINNRQWKMFSPFIVPIYQEGLEEK